jgi:hypothetical protein
MKPWAPVLAVFSSLGLVLTGAGCASGHGRARDAAADEVANDAPTDAPAADGASPDAADGPGVEVTIDAAPKPPPVEGEGTRLVVGGPAYLVGHGLDSCTNAPGVTSDRWCAFARPAADRFELWVLDVTRAAMGAAVACDGTDASCLRLSTHLYKNRMTGYVDHGFNGDTLVYGETTDRGEATTPFLGVIWAWRPGWPAGRSLTSSQGLFCMGHPASDAALCYDNRSGDGQNTNLTVDLYAGHLPAAGASGLPKVDTLVLETPTDPPGAPPRWRADLSPDGQYVAWSTRSAASAVETLHVSQLGAPAVPVVVATDVSEWAISADTGAWYWLAGYNYDVAGAPAGTLERDVFPNGGVTTLATGVGELGAVGDRGLWFRAGVTTQVGTLRFVPDSAALASATTIDTDVLTVLDHALQGVGTRFLYSKTYTTTRPGTDPATAPALTLLDLYVAPTPGGVPCVVSASPTALAAAFGPGGGSVLWARRDAVTGDVAGVATSVSSCQSSVFSTHLASLLPSGDTGVVTLEDLDPAANEATLRYAPVVDGAVGQSVLVETRAVAVVAPFAAAPPTVAFTVSAGGPADGLYLFTPPPASADAGTAGDGAATDAGGGS